MISIAGKVNNHSELSSISSHSFVSTFNKIRKQCGSTVFQETLVITNKYNRLLHIVFISQTLLKNAWDTVNPSACLSVRYAIFS